MLTLPAGRRSKYVVLVLAVLFFGGLASQSGKFEGVQKNESSSWLPSEAESLKALKAVQKLPGGELAPAVVVFERPSGKQARRQRVLLACKSYRYPDNPCRQEYGLMRSILE